MAALEFAGCLALVAPATRREGNHAGHVYDVISIVRILGDDELSIKITQRATDAGFWNEPQGG